MGSESVCFEGIFCIENYVARSLHAEVSPEGEADSLGDHLVSRFDGVSIVWHLKIWLYFDEPDKGLIGLLMPPRLRQLTKSVSRGIVSADVFYINERGHATERWLVVKKEHISPTWLKGSWVSRARLRQLTSADGALRLRLRLRLDKRVFAAVDRNRARFLRASLSDMCGRFADSVARHPDVDVVAADGAVFPANSFVLSLCSVELDRRLCQQFHDSGRLVLDDLSGAAVEALLRLCYAHPDAAVDALDALPAAAARYVPTSMRRHLELKLMARLESSNALDLLLGACAAHLPLLKAVAAHRIMHDDVVRGVVWSDGRLTHDMRLFMMRSLAVRKTPLGRSCFGRLGLVKRFELDLAVANYASLVGQSSDGDWLIDEREFATVRGRVGWLWLVRVWVKPADGDARVLVVGLKLLDGPRHSVVVWRAKVELLSVDSLRPAVCACLLSREQLVLIDDRDPSDASFQVVVRDADPDALKLANLISGPIAGQSQSGGSLAMRVRIGLRSADFDLAPATFTPMFSWAPKQLRVARRRRPWFIDALLTTVDGSGRRVAVPCQRAVLRTCAPLLANFATCGPSLATNGLRVQCKVLRSLVRFVEFGHFEPGYISDDAEGFVAAVVEYAPESLPLLQHGLLACLNAQNAAAFYSATCHRPQLAAVAQASGAAVVRASLDWPAATGEAIVETLCNHRSNLASLLSS